MRDFETEPYSPDERRVVDWIAERTKGAVGGGDDPIGFILHSLAYLRDKLKKLEPIAHADPES